MLTPSLLTLLFDYHYWANARLLEACARLTDEQWDQPLGHSWGSVHGLAVHMLGAEMLWLARWRGESPLALAKPQQFPALADVRQAWALVEMNLRAFVAACDQAGLDSDLAYRTTRGKAHALPQGQLMLHLANHGTHHRGEMAAMLALLEAPHPEDDLLDYLIEKQSA